MIKTIHTIEEQGPVTAMMQRLYAMFDRAKARNYVVEHTLTAGRLNKRMEPRRPARTIGQIRAIRARVLELHEMGETPLYIALETGCSKGSIYEMIANERRARAAAKGGR